MTEKHHSPVASSVEAKMRAKRRGPRMNSRVPLAVEWQEKTTNQPVHAQAHTRVVNFYGGLVIAPRPLALEQKMTITNLANQKRISAVVVYRGSKSLDGWEMGVELVNPEMDFWGIEL